MTTDDKARLFGLVARLCSLPSIEEQRALYETLSPEDQAEMDRRGLKRMWRSRRASEAHARRREQFLQDFESRIAEAMAQAHAAGKHSDRPHPECKECQRTGGVNDDEVVR